MPVIEAIRLATSLAAVMISRSRIHRLLDLELSVSCCVVDISQWYAAADRQIISITVVLILLCILSVNGVRTLVAARACLCLLLLASSTLECKL